MTYTRPEGKSGGHGVGWSEIPRYTFKVPPGWQESPVSIADLGGTEVKHYERICDCCRLIVLHIVQAGQHDNSWQPWCCSFLTWNALHVIYVI